MAPFIGRKLSGDRPGESRRHLAEESGTLGNVFVMEEKVESKLLLNATELQWISVHNRFSIFIVSGSVAFSNQTKCGVSESKQILSLGKNRKDVLALLFNI